MLTMRQNQVKLPSGERVYFRFYDPRVMRVFLPACTPEDTTQFFGPIQNYLVEDRTPEQLLSAAGDSTVNSSPRDLDWRILGTIFYRTILRTDMIIGDQQFNAFRGYMLSQFVSKMAGRLRAQFGGKSLPNTNAELFRWIEQMIDRAEQHGIISEFDVRRYLELCAEYGGDFDLSQWASAALKNTELTGEQKMDRLDAITTFAIRG
jgi:hypothetical protein